jgi:polar amino acid transport system substrate-binding protein
VHRRASFPFALVAVLLAAVLAACTSSPPLPSAGTQTESATDSTATPPGTAPSSSALDGTPASSTPASSTSTPTPTDQQPPTTPAPTMPAPDAIGTELVAPGSLTICLALLGAPASALNGDGQPVGYNVAFANELASRLSLTPVIQTPNFSEVISMVQSHACDISVSSQNITAGRSAQVNLIPYTQAKLGFPVVVGAHNPQKIDALDDLCGLAVSAAAGSTAVDQVEGTGDFTGRGLNAACEAGAKGDIDLHTYPSELAAVQALLDLSVVAYLGNANFVDQYPDALERSTAVLPAARQGIAVALDHPELTAGVWAALDAMISDGTYLQILRQYLPAKDVDNFSII